MQRRHGGDRRPLFGRRRRPAASTRDVVGADDLNPARLHLRGLECELDGKILAAVVAYTSAASAGHRSSAERLAWPSSWPALVVPARPGLPAIPAAAAHQAWRSGCWLAAQEMYSEAWRWWDHAARMGNRQAAVDLQRLAAWWQTVPARPLPMPLVDLLVPLPAHPAVAVPPTLVRAPVVRRSDPPRAAGEPIQVVTHLPAQPALTKQKAAVTSRATPEPGTALNQYRQSGRPPVSNQARPSPLLMPRRAPAPASKTVAASGDRQHVHAFVPVAPAAGVDLVLEKWDRLSALAPDPTRSMRYLIKHGGLSYNRIAHLRDVRNACAHPRRRGWPSQADIDRALRTAAELEKRVKAGA